MKLIKSAALLFGAMLCFSACSGEKSMEEPGTDTQPAITLDKSEAYIKIDGQVVLTATVTPSSKVSDLKWTSSNETVATVEDGVVTGKSIGVATVVAYIENTTAITSCKINVVETSVEKITLDKTEVSLCVGDSEQLSATVEPEDAEDKNIDWYSEDESVATVKDGLITAVKAGETNVVARIGKVESKCAVKVKNVPVTGISVSTKSVEIAVNETAMFSVTVTPDNATDKSLDYGSDNPNIATVAPITELENWFVISGVGAGETTITVFSAEGDVSDSIKVTVKESETPQEEPKIGDYYYSDGTWSDGGLISINEDGTNAVWADEKPTPFQGKTVIGIVFQTDINRIASTEQEKGFTHGYVVAARNAHASGKEQTRYSFDGLSCLSSCKLGTTWYNNIDGYSETNTVLMEYSGNISQCPAFDWTTTDFQPTAPTTSSGWFLPATGQMWDMIANLCGNEVAEYLRSNRTNGYDATYYISTRVSYDVIAAFNEKFAKIAESQREDLKRDNTYYGSCSIWTSSTYIAGESACIFSIGDLTATCGKQGGLVECMADWMDNENYARPILAF